MMPFGVPGSVVEAEPDRGALVGRLARSVPSLERKGSTQPLALAAHNRSPVSAGDSSKKEKRRREDGSAPQVAALWKRQEADPVRCKYRATLLQQTLPRPQRWPRSIVPGLPGKRCCAPDRYGTRRRALRLYAQ
jgi:hypothetical protein